MKIVLQALAFGAGVTIAIVTAVAMASLAATVHPFLGAAVILFIVISLAAYIVNVDNV